MHWAYKISFKILSDWLIIVPEISGGTISAAPCIYLKFSADGEILPKIFGGGALSAAPCIYLKFSADGEILPKIFGGRGTLLAAACIYGAGCCQSGLIRCVCGLIDWALSRVPRVTDRPHRQGGHDSAGRQR